MACTYDSSAKSKLVGSVALPNGMLALISTLRGKRMKAPTTGH